MLVLTAADVAQLIDMQEAIAASSKAFVLTAAGKAVVPVRHAVDLGYDKSVTLFMPGFIQAEKILGLKVGSLINANYLRGWCRPECGWNSVWRDLR